MSKIVPNTVDEDMMNGVDEFLKLRDDRTLHVKKELMSPRYGQHGISDLVNRSILGPKDTFI